MMTIFRCAVLFVFLSVAVSSAELPDSADFPAAITFDHFPSRLHAFIWRNWPVVPEARLAEVLGTSVENVRSVATSLGLPSQGEISPRWESPQGYITVLRRNWHLLPYEQLLVLLNQTAEQLAESLREDDFLFIKLGSIKPRCEPLRFEEPTELQQQQAARIAAWIKEELGNDWTTPEEPRFAFLDEFFPATKNEDLPAGPNPLPEGERTFELRFIFSYFATFGDPLLDPAVASYPDELLRQLAESGVNGIWLHTVLRDLSPSDIFSTFGKGHEIRIKSLRTLVERAERYGIKVFLYMNEPRAVPASVLVGDLEKLAGVPDNNYRSLCSSTPEVKRWLADSLTFVFREVPNLGGIFTITASENRTHCASHGQKDACPRCKERSAADIIAEVNTVMCEAVHAVNPDARVIAWDWGWNGHDRAVDIIERLPQDIWLMSVSEWALPIERGGVQSKVGEYSISSVGPGPRAQEHWQAAKTRGLKTAAKVQFNVTWELAAIPYLPVADLIAEHASNLSESGVNGLMLSWSLGGWPSPNLEIAREFQAGNTVKSEVLDRVAANRYGNGAAKAREAWTLFSNGYREFPYHIGLCYAGPQQWGAANLFFPRPTGYRATMVGIPYDDVNGWCVIYPPEVAAGQFRKIADHFAKGLLPLREAVALAPPERKHQAESEYRFADAARLHFAACANMIEFNTLRNRLLEEKNDDEKKRLVAAIQRIIAAELLTAREMYRLAKSDARIGYESSNHYFYLPLDIVEAIISAQYAKDVYRQTTVE